MGFAALYPSYVSAAGCVVDLGWGVGWVEPRETHRLRGVVVDGFRCTAPAHPCARGFSASMHVALPILHLVCFVGANGIRECLCLSRRFIADTIRSYST